MGSEKVGKHGLTLFTLITSTFDLSQKILMKEADLLVTVLVGIQTAAFKKNKSKWQRSMVSKFEKYSCMKDAAGIDLYMVNLKINLI